MLTSNKAKLKRAFNQVNQVITIENAEVGPSPAHPLPPITPEVARVLTFKSFVRTFQRNHPLTGRGKVGRKPQNKGGGSST